MKDKGKKVTIEYKDIPGDYKYHVFKWGYFIFAVLVCGIISIFLTHRISLFLVTIIVGFCVGLNMVYKIWLAMQNNVACLEGVCIEVFENTPGRFKFMQIKRNYIGLVNRIDAAEMDDPSDEKMYYKIYLSNPYKINEHDRIRVYAPLSALFQETENCISANSSYGYSIIKNNYENDSNGT